MSFSLKISNGDLCQQGSQLGIVYGTDKLKQDLTLWMSERYGVDRFHPGYGSNFQNYIGGVIGRNTKAMIQSEALRVLDNYQKVQYLGLRKSPTIFSLSELMFSVNAVNVGLNYDTVSVGISVSNAERQSTTINLVQGA